MKSFRMILTESNLDGFVYELYPKEVEAIAEVLADMGWKYEGYKNENKAHTLKSLVWSKLNKAGTRKLDVKIYDNGTYPEGFYISTGYDDIAKEIANKLLRKKIECRATRWKKLAPVVKVSPE